LSQIPRTGSNFEREITRQRVKTRRAPIAVRYQKHALVWALRLLVQGGYKQFHRTILDEEAFFGIAGIKPLGRGYTPLDVKKVLKERLPILESRLPKDMGLLSKNISLLGKSLGLNVTEQRVLAFAVILNNLKWFENCCDTLGALDSRMAQQAVATALALDAAETRNVFNQDSALTASGIMRLQGGNMDLKAKLQVLAIFNDVLFMQHEKADDLLHPFFSTSVPNSLSREDYKHAEAEWTLVADYLKTASIKGLRGVNILIHGVPGSGKTEFVRAISHELGMKLYEVSNQDMEGNPLEANQRLGAYQIAQRVLQKVRGQCLLFDEIEDVFPEASMELFGIRMKGARTHSKAWMNRLLEENPVISFWVSNKVDQLDVAYLRRWDIVIEMPKPSRNVRKKLLRHYLNGLPVTDGWMCRVAENPHLMPATIERAAKVVRLINPNSPAETEAKLLQVMRGSLDAMGLNAPLAESQATTVPYQIEFINADTDLRCVCDGLKRRGQGRLCLYGPPGTGKTAFAKHLAGALDKRLLIRRASDLLSKYVGEAEKNIASMFKEALQENAVLLLDEADGFLRDRGLSQYQHETMLTIELLTQMEEFQGMFVVTSNHFGDMDSACLRRLDFKIYFDYLRLDQRLALIRQVSGEANELPQSLSRRIQALDTLTPGDVSVAVRQAELRGEPLSAETLTGVLEQECAIKRRGMSPQFLGFTG